MKPFAWSWSKLKNWRSCPKRHYEVDIAKTYKEDESDALTWGNQVHSAFAKRVDKGTPLPIEMQRHDGWPSRIHALKEAGLPVMIERKLAIDKEFRPVGFFDASAWCRVVIDVQMHIESANAAITVDWKTGGKVEPEFEQLGISSQVIFSHYPDLQQVAAIYVWLGHETQTVKVYNRDRMPGLWNLLWPELQQMQEAHRTLTYPPKPSGLCIRWCPVTSCPYHGKGSR